MPDSVCRLCGTSEGIKFIIFDPGRDYVSKIHQLLPIMIHERDPWPKLICHRCAFKLQDFYDFRELCIKIDSYLKRQVPWEPPHQAAPVISQHIPTQPANVVIKEEAPDCPSSPPPPSLMPQQSPHRQRNVEPFASPPLLPPMVKFNQETSAKIPVHSNLFSKVQTANLQHTSIQTETLLPSSLPATNVVFLNSEQGECFLPEDSEAADSDSSAGRSVTQFPDENEQETFTQRTESRKRNNTAPSVKPPPKKKNTSKSHNKNQHNSVKLEHTSRKTQQPTQQISKENHKPGPKSCVRPQENSVKGDSIVKLNSNTKGTQEEGKVKRKPGPKSRVGSHDNLDHEDSDVEIVHYKPPNSVLDVIDMTDDIDSPIEEAENEGDPTEGLVPNVLLTKIPGICNIYTCSLCEGTFTTKKFANCHTCKIRVEFASSREKTSENNQPEETASSDSALWGKIPVDKESSNRGNTATNSNLSEASILQRVLNEKSAETEGKGSDNHDGIAGGYGHYECDICSARFTRQVTLMSHKDRHLYPMNEDDDSDNVGLFNVRKKKKSIPKPLTGQE